MANTVISYPEINGVRTSYCSISFGIESISVVGVKEINYEETDTITAIRGTSRKPIGRTAGTAEFKGSVVFYQKEFNKIILPKLIAIAGTQGHRPNAWAMASAPLLISYSEEASPEDTVVDTLVGARIHTPKVSHAEGTDALVVSCEISLMDILWNNFSALGAISPAP